MPDAEAESRKSEGNQVHRIDRGQLRSGDDEKTFLISIKSQAPNSNDQDSESRHPSLLPLRTGGQEGEERDVGFI